MIYKAGFSAESTIRKLYIDDVEVGNYDKHKEVLEAIANKGIEVKYNLSCVNEEDKGRIVIKKRHEVRPEQAAIDAADHLLSGILDRFEGYDQHIYMRGKSQWRYDVWPLYKHRRDLTPKPVHLKSIVRHYERKFNARVPQKMEADDACSINAYDCIRKGIDYVIVSVDKDLLQIPGQHFNYSNFFEGKNPNILVDPWDAEKFLWQQILSGDSTDDIPGCPGWGDTKSKNLLEDAQDQEELITAVYEKYQNVYGDDALEVMNMNASLVYLLRNPDEYWSLEL